MSPKFCAFQDDHQNVWLIDSCWLVSSDITLVCGCGENTLGLDTLISPTEQSRVLHPSKCKSLLDQCHEESYTSLYPKHFESLWECHM